MMSGYRLGAYIVLGIAVFLFGIVPVTLFSLVSSEAGSRWLLNQAKPLLPQTVQIGGLSGALSDQFTLTDVAFRSDNLSLEFPTASVAWSPWALLDGKLEISHLRLGKGNIRWRSVEGAEQAASGDLSKLSFESPVAVNLKQFTLAPSWLFVNDLPEQQLSSSLAATLSPQGKLTVSNFTIEHQYLTSKTSFNATLQYPFRFTADQQLALHSPDYPRTDIHLDAGGNMEQINAALKVEKSTQLSADIQLDNLLQSLQWQADLTVRETTVNPWLAAFSNVSIPTTHIDGSVSARGNLSQATIQPGLTLSTADDQVNLTGQFSVNQQQLQLAALTADISGRLQGHVVSNGNIELAGSPKLNLELKTDSLRFAENHFSGTHQLQGPMDNLQINSQGRLSTSQAPSLQLNSRALLTAEAFHLNQLNVEEVDGRGQLTGQASVDWQSGIVINANMDGRLLQSPVAIASQLKIEQPYVFVDHFNVQWRDSSLQATGSMAPGRQLTIKGDIQQLQKLPIPAVSLAGDLAFTAGVSGTLNQPSGSLEARSQRLKINERWLSEVELKAKGSGQQQQLSVSLKDEFVQLALTADNRFSDQQINTDISELVVTPVGMQPFSLSKPTALQFQFQPSVLSLSPLCLSQPRLDDPLCISATPDDTITRVELSAPMLPLTPFNSVLAGANITLAGTASAQAQASIDIGQQSLSHLNADISAADVQVTGLEESFVLDTIRLTAKPNKDNSDTNATVVTLNASANDVGLNVDGKMNIDALTPEASINGRYQARLNDLRLLQVIAPNLSTAEGSLQASLNIDGQLQQPMLRPQLQADISKLQLTSTGTVITNSQLTVERQNSQSDMFLLSANGTIGEGQFTMSGDYDYSAQQLQAKLNGQALQLLDTPRLSVRVSPELTVSLAQQDLSVTGNVHVPYARITPPDIDNTVQPSPDVVVKQNAQQQQRLRTSANIRLTLGDDVRVEAFGFEGRVDGALSLNQQPNSLTRANGQINVASGNYEIYGQELTINKGQLIYNGGPIDNPGLNLQVVRAISEAPNAPERIGAQVTGTLIEPQLSLFSNPPMPDAHVLSYLLFGRAPNSSAESSNLELQAALLVSGDVTQAFTQNLKDAFGLDEVMIDSSTNDVNDTSLYIGKYLSPNLYIKYGIGLIESTSSFFLRYQLSDHLWLESTSSTESQGGDLIYSVEK